MAGLDGSTSTTGASELTTTAQWALLASNMRRNEANPLDPAPTIMTFKAHIDFEFKLGARGIDKRFALHHLSNSPLQFFFRHDPWNRTPEVICTDTHCIAIEAPGLTKRATISNFQKEIIAVLKKHFHTQFP